MSQLNPSMATKKHGQYKDRREQVQATINQLLLFTREKKKVLNLKLDFL